MKPLLRHTMFIVALVIILVAAVIVLAQLQHGILANGTVIVFSSLTVFSLIYFLARQGWKVSNGLTEQHRRLVDIINLLPDAAWAIDMSGTVIVWNKAAEELTGVNSSDMVGRKEFDYAIPFYGERRPVLIDLALTPNAEQEAKYESFRRKGETVEAEIFIPHFGTGGTFVWARACRLLDASGQVIGAIETVRDITERKRLQEIMMQTEKMVTVGGLAAGMAHEINNPLGAIVQNIQNIQRRLSPGLAANDQAAEEIDLDFQLMQRYLKQRGIFDLLELMTTAGTRVSDIVVKMMSFSHMNSALLEPVELDQLINQSLDLVTCDYDLKSRYDFSTINIARDYDPALPPILVNRAELQQAMTNLIRNAIQSLSPPRKDYTPQVSVRTIYKQSHLAIEIEDNGCGIEPEISRRIFEPFFTTKEVGGGTGLGLAVTYALVVNNHHGSIEVESISGRGSKFTVSLPVSNGHCHESRHIPAAL